MSKSEASILNKELPETLLVIKEHEDILIRKLDKETLTIGRSSGDDILLRSKGVSRCHATIYFSKGVFWIADGDLKDRFSTNGLYVNGHRVTVHRLEPYDIIGFQKGVYAFFLSQDIQDDKGHLLEELSRNLACFISGKDVKGRALTRTIPSLDKCHPTVAITDQPSWVDSLTKLPNREAFFTRIRKSLELRQNNSEMDDFAVLFIDVDRFKMINDSLGHLIGDKFLIELSRRFQSCLREGDMVARLGGDEFGIFLDKLPSAEKAITIAKRLQQSLANSLTIDNRELYSSISIGIALSSLNYQSVEEIIRDADTAMYHAKNTGRSRFVIFDKEMHENALKLLRLDGDLRKAIDNRELQLYYQPIVSLSERKLVGFEALIRWFHPKNGLISPTVFIPIAEENNLIYQVGQWVFDEACYQLSLWKQNPAIASPLSVNINVSSKQIAETRLVERLTTATQKYGIMPDELKLEVTESILMESTMHSLDVLNQLKKAGFQLGIDDFGTGYSSLSYLNKFPIDTLKIDRSFISDLDKTNGNTNVNITTSIITLAHSLGVKVVAEGIERLYHLAWLRQQRCDYGQGFLFSQPLTADEATRLAEEGLNWTWKC